MRRDLSHFLIAYALAMVAGAIDVVELHYVLAVALIVFYGYYVWETMKSEGDLEGDTKPLYFHRHPEMPHRRRIFLQIGVALGGIILGAEIFVEQVQVAERVARRQPADRLAAHHPDRHGVAGEVQLGALGAPAQGHARPRQHHGSDGLSEHVPGLDRPRLHDAGSSTRSALVSGVLALVSGLVFYVTLRIAHR